MVFNLVWLVSVGKVHGSLARAGKVRGQTPKVAKQEKKKQPKGRAMKRIKYNRRFVNTGRMQGASSCVLQASPCTAHLWRLTYWQTAS